MHLDCISTMAFSTGNAIGWETRKATLAKRSVVGWKLWTKSECSQYNLSFKIKRYRDSHGFHSQKPLTKLATFRSKQRPLRWTESAWCFPPRSWTRWWNGLQDGIQVLVLWSDPHPSTFLLPTGSPSRVGSCYAKRTKKLWTAGATRGRTVGMSTSFQWLVGIWL